MLHSLKIKNFSSFREEQEFSLLGTKTTHNDQRFMATSSGGNVARVAMIFGANASGKTNFLKALSFLGWFIRHSWRGLSQKQLIPFTPFSFTDTSPTTHFQTVVESDAGNVYAYSLELTPEKIFQESLKVQRNGKGRFFTLFSRKNDAVKVYPKNTSKVDTTATFSMNKNVQTLLRSNASFISTLLQTETRIFADFISAMRFASNVQFLGRTQEDVHLCFDILSNDAAIKHHVEEFIQKSDTGIDQITIDKVEIDKEEEKNMRSLLLKTIAHMPSEDMRGEFSLYQVSTIHRVNGKDYPFSFELESNGTQQLVFFLAKALLVLRQGGIFVYDELEHGIHPLLLQRLLDLFYNEETNPGKSQLICTCHATDPLNFLHKRQIFFIEKNKHQESSLFRLSDMTGLRTDDNIARKYLSGTYGGVPYL